MSSATEGSPQHRTTSFGSRGNRGRYTSDAPPPAEHVSFDPGQVGTRYGWVEIISPERRYTRGWSALYVLTRCTGCGAEQWTYLTNLRVGRSKGCQACSRPRRVPRYLDQILTTAKQRCTNPNDGAWPNYGGRGIAFEFDSVLEAGEWILENLGPRPKGMELDRVDNNAGYAPGNLRWASREQQAANRRNTRLPHGFRQEEWPYSESQVSRRIARGMTRAEINADAEKAVREKRKNWRTIEARLQSLTC